MAMTLDLTDDEADYMRRAITAHMIVMTEELRALEGEHSAAWAEQMYADIRTAATLAGRLPFHRFARSNARSTAYERNSTGSSGLDCGERVERRLPSSTDSAHPTGDERGND